MRTCKESAELMCKADRTRLSATEWLGLHLHLLFCGLCRGHRRNNQILKQAIRLLLRRKNVILTLPTTTRQRIAEALKRTDRHYSKDRPTDSD